MVRTGRGRENGVWRGGGQSADPHSGRHNRRSDCVILASIIGLEMALGLERPSVPAPVDQSSQAVSEACLSAPW